MTNTTNATVARANEIALPIRARKARTTKATLVLPSGERIPVRVPTRKGP